MQVGRGMTVNNAVRQCHTRTTTGCDTNRVHTATEEQAPRFGAFTEQERPVRSEALGAVEQHADIGVGQAGQATQGIFQHRFEVVPVLGSQLKGEVLADLSGIDRLAHGFETADQQTAGIITDIQVTVVIGQRGQISRDAVERIG